MTSESIIVLLFPVIVRQTTPVLLAALGGMFCYRAGCMNISLEGLMLISAFTSISVTAAYGHWAVGMIAGIIASVLFAMIHAFLTIKYKAQIIITGFVINTLASAITVFLLQIIHGVTGSYMPKDLCTIPIVNFFSEESQTILGALINGHSIVFWIALGITVILSLVLYKTPYGTHVIAVGENATAARSVGIKDTLIKYSAFVICAVLCGIAGSYYSTGATNIFVRDMIAGMGFMGIAVMHLGRNTPFGVLLASLIFGTTKSVALYVKTSEAIIALIPAQFIEMMPYLITIIILVVDKLVSVKKKLA